MVGEVVKRELGQDVGSAIEDDPGFNIQVDEDEE